MAKKPKQYQCFYCHKPVLVVLPCDCPECGAKLHGDYEKMKLFELGHALKENGLKLDIKFVPKEEVS